MSNPAQEEWEWLEPAEPRGPLGERLTAWGMAALGRTIGSPILFGIVYTSLASAVFFSLGVVVDHALGLTPLVFLLAAGLFGLTALTYVEGASLHQEPGGATVFARYAFNELVSFIAGWAILLDYIILIAVAAYAATQYLKVFWAPLGHHIEALLLAFAIIAYVVLANIRGLSARRGLRIGVLVLGALALELFVIVLGLILYFDPSTLRASIHLGRAPTWPGLIFALTITTMAFTSLEYASGLAGEVIVAGRALRRLLASGIVLLVLAYVGVGLAAVSVFPVHGAYSALAHRYLDDPVIGLVARLRPHALAVTLRYLLAAVVAVTLIAAANSAMLGLSRLSYSLSTNRQIPSGLGRLHQRRLTPYVLIVLAGLLAAVLVIPEDIDFLVGIYAFGAVLAFTIAHLSVVALRYREPARRRPFKVPLSVRLRGGELPLPAVFGALLSAAGWVALIAVHRPARYVGLGWMAAGLVLYLVYRRRDESSPLERVTVAPEVLRPAQPREREYGSILVPLYGGALEQEIVSTAALLVAGAPTDAAAIDTATIEAVWIFQMPMALTLDARLPESHFKRAREALARAKELGERHPGVHVATATARARGIGQGIVEEARRRGVEAIVLGVPPPSIVRGGAHLGGHGGSLGGHAGQVVRYVVARAACRVIVTAPPVRKRAAADDPRAPHRAVQGQRGAPIVN
ncbi:MAG TPA: APC family permease [Solirubrobacteraceae bacterium]|nr:APC family permease [Solirubrobacteraceae bacterium]